MKVGERTITQTELRVRYDHLIKDALVRADPDLVVTRADDIATPGLVTGDIFEHLLTSDIVVADITYPNPNVFYELGLRHACRTGTLILRGSDSTSLPFDVSHLRHISYDTSVEGLARLTETLRMVLPNIGSDPNRMDNQFLDTAKILRFSYPKFDAATPEELKRNAMKAAMSNPAAMQQLLKNIDPAQNNGLVAALASDPQVMSAMADYLASTGALDIQPNRDARRAKKRK